MLSTIYRYRDEFINSQDSLETALYETTTYYREDQKFLYFYTLIVMNLMTYYHRQDQYSALDGLYKETLQVLDESLSLHNFAYMMIRIGINKHYMADMYSDAL